MLDTGCRVQEAENLLVGHLVAGNGERNLKLLLPGRGINLDEAVSSHLAVYRGNHLVAREDAPLLPSMKFKGRPMGASSINHAVRDTSCGTCTPQMLRFTAAFKMLTTCSVMAATYMLGLHSCSTLDAMARDMGLAKGGKES